MSYLEAINVIIGICTGFLAGFYIGSYLTLKGEIWK